MKYSILLIFFTLSFQSFSQAYKYCVFLKDKNNSPYSVDQPGEFLSEKAIGRREKFNIPIDTRDLPVNPDYIKQIEQTGCKVTTRSRWLNTVTILADSSYDLSLLLALPFVEKTECTYKPGKKKLRDKLNINEDASKNEDINSDNWGYASGQIKIHRGNILHEKGFTGKGITIAVIDAGFDNMDALRMYASQLEKGTIRPGWNFVNQSASVYGYHSHGTQIISTMAANLADTFVGTAPDANYVLLISEDGSSEYPVEEDNWVAAAEFADSIGVDIINSSLGYNIFDDTSLNHSWSTMDGNHARISVAADIAVSKGIVVVTSAGNEGDDPWLHITAPADADSIVAVGAINTKGLIASFSSLGPSFDGQIKPDIMAVGHQCYFISPSGTIKQGNGTSFSSPVACGLFACLMQAFPTVTPVELIETIKKASSGYDFPDTLYGYGIPDFFKAYEMLQGNTLKNNISRFFNITEAGEDTYHIQFITLSASTATLQLFDTRGIICFENNYTIPYEGYTLILTMPKSVSSGMYIARIINGSNIAEQRILRIK